MRAIAVALALLLTGCTMFTLVENKPVTIGEQMVVDPGTRWNKATNFPHEAWTMDGPSLDMLVFWVVEDGKPLMEPRNDGQKDKRPPVFKSGMSEVEVMEFAEASLSHLHDSPAKARNLRPQDVGGVQGFRFSYEVTAKDEVERDGEAIGAIRNGKLYLMTYTGTRLHHFAKTLPQAEKAMLSARFK